MSPPILDPIRGALLRSQPDARLVTLTRQGRERAFEEIVRRYRAPLVGFAAMIVPTHRADDVVQESLLRAFDALQSSDAEIQLRPWLFRIVRNQALNDVRDTPAHDALPEEIDGVPQPDEIAERREQIAALVGGLKALPDAQREAIVSRELEGRGHAEIAAELGTSPGAVRQLIFRARGTLRGAAGLLIPLPLLRALIGPGSAEAAAAGAGAAGIGAAAAAAGGGAATGVAGKVAIGLAGVALAVGGGVAVERSRDGDDRVASAKGAEPGDETTSANRAAGSGPAGSGSSAGGSGGGGDADSASGSSRSAGHGGASSGPGGGGGSSGPGGGEDGSDDSSGPGGGDFDEDSETDDSSGSGSSGSGSDGDAVFEPDEIEPAETQEVDSSGSGSSGSGSDSSGSGSSGSGSGSSGSGSDSSGSGSGGELDP